MDVMMLESVGLSHDGGKSFVIFTLVGGLADEGDAGRLSCSLDVEDLLVMILDGDPVTKDKSSVKIGRGDTAEILFLRHTDINYKRFKITSDYDYA